MLNRFYTYISKDYLLKYEIPESFFDEETLSYMDNRYSKYINYCLEELDNIKKSIALGIDDTYYLLKKYFYEEFKLKPAEKSRYRIRSKYRFKFDNDNSKSKNIDLDAIKENVKCEDLLGTPERTDGKRLWYKLRNEKTASCCVYKDNNSFYDFGSGEGGTVIDLFMKLNKCDVKEAIRELARN